MASIDPWLVYTFILVMTFGESAAFLGLVFPGEVALVAAAALAVSAGIDPIILGAVATAGALAGGIFGYAIGSRYGQRLVSWSPIERRLGDRVDELRPMLAGTEAGALVAVARFNQVTRAVVPALAGMAGMGRVRFAVANGIGALVWAAAFTAIGFYAAEWWHSTSTMVHVPILAAVAVGAGYWLIKRWRRKARSQPEGDSQV
ncbi:MAG TPA: DedA family protein [Acidimicrobiia bacterium]|nr:DedA family protein [Acidimicrobiia bacterium]